jgi:hypothetical protein
MNLEAIRRIVEEEVTRSLSAARSTPRLRRPVVSESMIVAARRRGSAAIEVTPGSIVTPAARERAASLGVAIHETKIPPASACARTVIEAVMAKVVAELEGRAASPLPSALRAKRLITARDVELLRFRDHPVITLVKGVRITPLARDLAESNGIRIVEENR